MKGIIDAAVDDYTARNLPMLHREIRLAEERKSRRPYRAGEGLDPEFLGLDLDPEPVPDQPFLFTLSGLEADAAAEANEPAPRPFTMEEKEALREEVRLADEFAKQLGRRICVELAQHRERIAVRGRRLRRAAGRGAPRRPRPRARRAGLARARREPPRGFRPW